MTTPTSLAILSGLASPSRRGYELAVEAASLTPAEWDAKLAAFQAEYRAAVAFADFLAEIWDEVLLGRAEDAREDWNIASGLGRYDADYEDGDAYEVSPEGAARVRRYERLIAHDEAGYVGSSADYDEATGGFWVR